MSIDYSYGSNMNWLFASHIGQITLLLFCLLLARHFVRMYLIVVVRKGVETGSRESVEAQNKRIDTLTAIIGTVLTLGLSLIGLIVMLVIFNVNIAGLVAGLSAAGVVLGLIGQSVIKDVLAGFFIIVENQYRVGDVIALQGVSGTVEELSLRATKLRDMNGDLHVIANSTADVITNKTHGWSNVNLVISVSYDADITLVQKTIDEVGLNMKTDEDWAMYIIEPIEFLRVDNFADSAVEVRALGRVEPGQQWSVAGEYRARLKKAFDKANIEIPYPQQVVHNTDLDKKKSK